ncbi:MAG: hypothetical protein IPI32_03615 [Austwickia sp.]|nr:hypothetical protein [Austwickia sp.]MBK9100352.1 hypothetical protein [Austwickia sp.]
MPTCELVAADAPLLHAYRSVVDVLDTDRRAWIVGLGRLVGVRSLDPTPDLGSLLAQAMLDGKFPTGPCPMQLGDLVYDCGTMSARAEMLLPAGRPMEYRIVAGPRSLAVALTRNGYLDDGTVDPGHVQLADAESLLVDAVVLTQRLARLVSHVGVCHLALGIASDIPQRPLELRAFDEEYGERLRPPIGYDEFDPVYGEFRTDLAGDDLDLWLWDTSLSVAEQFGVFMPQMIRRPQGSQQPTWRLGPL